MNKTRQNSLLSLALTLLAFATTGQAQQSAYENFRARNTAMAAVQPSWMAPLVQTDSRLAQAVRISVSNSYTAAGTETVNYGNWHLLGLIAGNRVQLNLMAPPYVQNNSAAKDGFGDPMAELKVRLLSGNAQHGDFIVTAMLAKTFATGSYQNGAPTGLYFPTLAAGKAWGRYNLQTTLGGTMPTGKIALQGRQVLWNSTAQVHVNSHVWLDIEDNATYNFAGPIDGKTENFVTPAAYLVIERKDWKPTHPVVVFDAGMQIATSTFHPYNHNVISEIRMLF